MAVSSGFLLFHTQFLSLSTQDPSLGYAKSVGVLLAACSRLAVPYILIYASCGLTEGRDESRHFSYRAIRPSDEICQRYISRVSEQFPQPPTITTMLLCATCSDSFLSYSCASPQSPATPLFDSPVRSWVLRYFLVPDSATAPASPLCLKAAAEGRGSPQPPRSLPSGSHTVFR